MMTLRAIEKVIGEIPKDAKLFVNMVEDVPYLVVEMEDGTMYAVNDQLDGILYLTPEEKAQIPFIGMIEMAERAMGFDKPLEYHII